MRAKILLILLRSFFHNLIDCFTNLTKSSGNIQIGKPNHFQTLAFQVARPFAVIFLLLNFVMLRSVQFHHQFCLMAVKINDIFSNTFLPLKTNWIVL